MPIHFFYGNEDFLIEKEINKLKQEILKGDINELNYKSIDNPPFALFSELLRTNAMMFGDIVIQIKCPHYFLDSKKNKITLDDKQSKELIDDFNNISDRVHIILLCPTPKGEDKKPDSRKKIYKELIKITSPIAFQQFKYYEENKVIPIIKNLAKELDLNINNEECLFLIQLVGTSIRDLYNQLEKIKLYIYPKKLIDKESIKEVSSTNIDVFNIADMILKKDYSSAFNMISEILQKEHYLPLLALLQTNFSNFVNIKIYSKTMNSFEITNKLKMKSEFIVKKIITKLKNISLDELLRIKINLSKAEYNLKTGVIKDPICALELALIGK